ncbi:MAG: LURP-one-related family protein [Caldilineaceae bacterium]
MRFILNERIFSLRDSYYIRNEQGDNTYEVTGRLISLRDKLALRDLKGYTLATITEKMLSLRPVYTIERSGQPQAKVKKDFINVLREGFSVDMEDGLPDLRIQGDILDHNYTISREGVNIAQISKKWISLRDSYAIDVAEGEDPVLLIACAIVVDRIAHDDEKFEDD